jgi:serine/threonine protein kinase
LVKLIKETDSSIQRDSTAGENATERIGQSSFSAQDVSKATLLWESNQFVSDKLQSLTIRSRHADNDRFRIIRQHARGGLGVVFVAEDQQLHRPVALKQLRDDRGDSDQVRRRFLEEAEITGQLEHPGVVPIYALGIDPQGKPYYAMRFIGGQDMGSRIREFHRDYKASNEAFDGPNLKHLLRRFLDVCNAMEYAHSRGILHRDLKPSNIMLGKYGETLVVDWGLAKVLPGFSKARFADDLDLPLQNHVAQAIGDVGGETRQGEFMGTIAYASPEQLRGDVDRLGPSTDIYSLGAILYEVLTDQPPIQGQLGLPQEIAQHIERQCFESFWRHFPLPRSACIDLQESDGRKNRASLPVCSGIEE